MAEEEADERWDDWEEDEDPVQSLLCPVIFPSAKAALRSDADDFDFDLKELIGKMGLDVYGGVKAVNYVRSRVKELGGTATKAQALEIKQALLAGALDGSGDELLLPVLENDALLCSLDEMLTGGDGVVRESGDEVAALEAEIESLKEELVQARALVQQVTGISEVDADDDPDSKDVDTYYFDSYGKIGIHEEMLRDKVRTGGYQRAIMSNPELFRGRTVLDVGCGTGVLSMFAAKAGAKRVIGVDMSDMIDHARKLVEINGFSDVVTLLKGKVEEVKLPVKEVDIIISEWMGYCLLYECMLPAVLLARDKYLAPGGTVLPDKCPMFVEGLRDDQRLSWWDNVHGLDFSEIRPLALRDASVEVVPQEGIVTRRALLKDIDTVTIRDEDLDFEAPFTLQPTSPGLVHGLVISFDSGFVHGCQSPEWFSTGAQTEPTHWKQTVLWLDPSNVPHLGGDDTLQGTLIINRRESNPRELDLDLKWKTVNAAGDCVMQGVQYFQVC